MAVESRFNSSSWSSIFRASFYHKNYLDHVYAVSDDTGNLDEHYRYTAFGEATIYNGTVSDEAQIYGNASLNSGNPFVGGASQVFGYAQIQGSAIIRDRAQVYGSAFVRGKVKNSSQVFGQAVVESTGEINGVSTIHGTAVITTAIYDLDVNQ